MGFLLRKLLSCSSVVDMILYPSSVHALGWCWVLMLFEVYFFRFFCTSPRGYPDRELVNEVV